MHDRTHDGKAFRILNIIDEYTMVCLAIRVKQRFNHRDDFDLLMDFFCESGVPVHLRSDNGSEFTTIHVREWLRKLAVKSLFFEPGSPRKNGYIESFNGEIRDELLDQETFYSLDDVQVLIEM